jgi:hypothetical protein
VSFWLQPKIWPSAPSYQHQGPFVSSCPRNMVTNELLKFINRSPPLSGAFSRCGEVVTVKIRIVLNPNRAA